MTLPASEETAVPSTDEQIAVLESWLDERYRPVRVGIARNVLRALIARIRSEREQAVRECAEKDAKISHFAHRIEYWSSDAKNGGFADTISNLERCNSLAKSILSLSQVSAKK